jgi:hypothetical protein
MKKSLEKRIRRLQYRYNKAKSAKVGEEVVCPFCKKKFIKTTYHKTFCCNAKTRKKSNCKDNFWNLVDPEKRCRNTPYFENVILQNYALSLGYPDMEALEEAEDNFDGSWDAHQAYTEPCNICHMRQPYCHCGENLDMVD